MLDPLVEPKNVRQRSSAGDRFWRGKRHIAIQARSIEPSFGVVLDDRQRAPRLREVLNNHVLQFGSKKVFDDGFAVGFHFHKVRQDPERLPVRLPNVIEELLNGFRAVRAPYGQFPDGVQTMSNGFFAALGFSRGFDRPLRVPPSGPPTSVRPRPTGASNGSYRSRARVLFPGRSQLFLNVRAGVASFSGFAFKPLRLG